MRGKNIFQTWRAYNKSMKIRKIFLTATMAVLVAFVTAVALCVRALNVAQSVAAFSNGNMRIVLDAGHGGIDGGVSGVNTGVRESDVNLAITHRLREVLTDMGFEVVLTRKTEAGLYDTTAKGFKKRDMQKRKEIIRSADPALVVSVHQNFYPSKSSRGAQVFYKKSNEQARKFATALQDKLNGLYAEEGVKGRKISTGDYFMLDCADCPSVIVECGFLSNATDEALLSNADFQRKIAQAIASGVLSYLSDTTA